ncbi:hypothetical protein SLE2022_383350 [Rubroshorea leprosula]
MWYLLNERGIIDVYVEHVCDEPNILDLLKGGTVPHEAIDEGTMHFSGSDEDIGEGCVTQNSQPTPTCNEAPKTAEGEADETDAVNGRDAVHGSDAAQQQDPDNNDHDDEGLPIVRSDADDEDIWEGYVTQNSQLVPNCNEARKTAKRDADETDAVHGDDASQQ